MINLFIIKTPLIGNVRIFIIIKDIKAIIKFAKGPANETIAWSLSKFLKLLGLTGTAFIQPIIGIPVKAASKGKITVPKISI